MLYEVNTGKVRLSAVDLRHLRRQACQQGQAPVRHVNTLEEAMEAGVRALPNALALALLAELEGGTAPLSTEHNR